MTNATATWDKAFGGYYIPGFPATRHGFVTRTAAIAHCRAHGIVQRKVVRVCNRFWRGYAIVEAHGPDKLRLISRKEEPFDLLLKITV